jgi:hypothetical protein
LPKKGGKLDIRVVADNATFTILCSELREGHDDMKGVLVSAREVPE